ncbi:MAG: glutathione transferase GstA [Tatlockia sp.]|nr:glutathione transferase GstA [Tatlockia sp.]
MKLYYTKGACSLAIHILINEIGIDCDYESVDLKTKKTSENKDYLAINPKGAVPALELDNKQLITENLIIQQYLVDQFKASELCPPVGDLQRYRVLEWSNYISTEVHKSFANLFNPEITKEMQETIFIPMIKKKLSYLNQQLAKHSYLTGKHFALPDAYLFVMLLWAKNMKIDLDDLPEMKHYFAELATRPSITKSLNEEGIEITI